MKKDIFGGWEIDIECYNKILEILEPGKTILELGSGLTTDKLAENYTMYSIEHDEKWLNKYNSNYIYSPIVKEHSEDPPIYWYDRTILEELLTFNYDLILVDGPVGALSPNRMTRDGFRRNFDLFDSNSIIIFDDVQRKWEFNSMMMLVDELDTDYEIFDSGLTTSTPKKFGVINNS